jgi:hypothetical protein
VEVVARVAAFAAGVVVVIGVLGSAIMTVVVPRAEPARLTRAVFLASRRLFDLRVRRTKDWESADRVMARYAPTTLIVLPAVWVVLVLAAFVPMYWAVGVSFPRDAVMISGSSLLTLGFAFRKDLPDVGLSFAEATLGLGLVALLISYLPTIYGQFSRREVLVGQMDSRAGTPPSPAELLKRAHRIGWLDQLDDLWGEWDRWFVEVEESHTSNGSLAFFRSQHHERSWITAAGCILDTAALRSSTLELPRTYRAELCLRSGYLALRRIADFFDVPYDPSPQSTDPISVTRDEYDAVYDELEAAGLPLKPDRDQAWRDFAGWRVNYDAVLLAIAGLVMAPYAQWSSDRSVPTYRPRVIRRQARDRG